MFSSSLHLNGEDLFLISSFLWGPMIWTWSDYRVVTSLGMRHALGEKTHTRAMLRTFANIVAFPWAPYFPVLIWMASNRVDESGAALVTFVWAIGGAIYQGIRAKRERRRVIRDLRTMVAGGGQIPPKERRWTMWWNLVRSLQVRTGNLARS